MDNLHFLTLGGDSIALRDAPSSVAEARTYVAESEKVKYPSQIVLLMPDGQELKDGDALPASGNIQVQKIPPPEGTWSRVMWDSNNLDETVLREALGKAFPPPLSQIDFASDDDPKWHPEDFWNEDETWARWTSRKMQQATIRAVGSWANYWGFAQSADTYGYWMIEAPYRSKHKSIELYVSNVKHWRNLLRELDKTFAEIRERTLHMNAAETWEIAAAELLKYSPSKEGCKTSFKYGFETWYWPFVQVLEWFGDFIGLEVPSRSCIGLEPEFDRDGFLKLILTPWGNGVFQSYSVKADGAKVFAEKMAEHYGIEFESFDSTARWLEQRDSLMELPSTMNVDEVPCQVDVHFQYICSIDRRRSHERAEFLKDALLAARQDARSDRPLTLDMVCRWQQSILGLEKPASLRSTDAYAKAGRERYPYSEELQRMFEDALTAAISPREDSSVPVDIRAARAYLDVCFLHPFDDGNARLARILMDYVLTKSGMCLRDVGDMFAIPYKATEQNDSVHLIKSIQKLSAPIGLNRDDELQTWASSHKSDALFNIRKRKFDGTDYEWFDCVTDNASLDRE